MDNYKNYDNPRYKIQDELMERIPEKTRLKIVGALDDWYFPKGIGRYPDYGREDFKLIGYERIDSCDRMANDSNEWWCRMVPAACKHLGYDFLPSDILNLIRQNKLPELAEERRERFKSEGVGEFEKIEARFDMSWHFCDITHYRLGYRGDDCTCCNKDCQRKEWRRQHAGLTDIQMWQKYRKDMTRIEWEERQLANSEEKIAKSS